MADWKDEILAARTSTATNVTVTAQGSSLVVRPELSSRQAISVVNPGAQPVWLALGGVASPYHGVQLNPSGGAWVSNTFTGTVAAVATAGASAILSVSDIG